MGEVRYVVGFMFSPKRRYVALIRKDHPEWQAGKLNGIGGKIEDGDASPAHAMSREFEEEAGVPTHPEDWSRIATMRGTDADGWSWDVAVFACRSQRFSKVRTVTSEPVRLYRSCRVPQMEVVHNLRWLIPFACDPNRPFIEADYSESAKARKAARQDRVHHEERVEAPDG